MKLSWPLRGVPLYYDQIIRQIIINDIQRNCNNINNKAGKTNGIKTGFILWMIPAKTIFHISRAHSKFVPSQWKMALLCNDASHWQDATLESALIRIKSSFRIARQNDPCYKDHFASQFWNLILQCKMDLWHLPSELTLWVGRYCVVVSNAWRLPWLQDVGPPGYEGQDLVQWWLSWSWVLS